MPKSSQRAVKDILKVSKDDDTEVRVIMEGKRMIIMVPSQRLDAGIEYTTGFTAAAAAMTQAIIDLYDVPIYKANMVKAAVWGRYPQTLNFLGSNLKSILEVPQNNEGAGYALRNIMANHIVALSGKNAMNAAALSSIFEQTAAFEMGDAIGPFEREHLLALAYPGTEREQHDLRHREGERKDRNRRYRRREPSSAVRSRTRSSR